MKGLLLGETTPKALGDLQTTGGIQTSDSTARDFPLASCCPYSWPRKPHPSHPNFDLPTLQGPALNYLDRAVQWAEECDLEAWG